MLRDAFHLKGLSDIVKAKIENYSKQRVQDIESSEKSGRTLTSEAKYRQAEQDRLTNIIGQKPTFIAVIIRIVITVGLMLAALSIITGEPIFFSGE